MNFELETDYFASLVKTFKTRKSLRMLWLHRNGLLQPINRFRNDGCLWSHCEVRRTEAILDIFNVVA